MSKLTCLVLCALAVAINSVFAEGDIGCREDFKLIEQECLKELNLSNDDLEAAMKARNVVLMEPCFFGCVFKKIGLLNDKGQFDLEAGLAGYKKLTSNDMRYEKFKKGAEDCKSVQDKVEGDEDGGCERGMVLAACILNRPH